MTTIATAAARPTKVRLLVLAAACSLAIVTYIHRVGFATASAEIREPLGLSDGQLGALMAAFMVAYGLFEIPWGVLGDRVGVRSVLSIVILGGSALTAALALVFWLPPKTAWSFGALFALRFLFGAFQAGTFPAISRMIADWIPMDERGRVQGLVWMSSRLGGVIAPMLMVWLFKVMGAPQWPLVLIALLGVAWCAAFRPWFRNRPEDMPALNEAERQLILRGRLARSTSHHEPLPWSRALRSTSVWSLCLMYGCLGYTGNFFLTLLPTYLATHRSIDSNTTATLTSLPFAFGIASCLIGGVVSDLCIRRFGPRWGRPMIGSIGMAVAASAFLAIPWAADVRLLGVLLCLTFAGNDLAMAPAWAAAADIGERHAGALSGMMNMFSSLTAAVGAVVAGRLFGIGSLTLPFIIFSAAYLIGAICWLGVDGSKTLSAPADA
ncbi:MAG: MFS transporter [Paludisphaera borealis]|uniref:MFS transporter n=1 Tax=Paludisphaera borealis TaxID=1387353 RepID=UPI0028414158|nr:MFS transporter [Paludisphaera borealis]MDR3622171.1 MFS transporter [Paludisphaera borealis]